MATGLTAVTVYDYRTGTAMGTALVDMAIYLEWMEGYTEVVEAGRILGESDLDRLGIDPDQTVYVQE